MKECLRLALVIVLLSVGGANLGLDIAYFFGSPGIEHSAEQGTTYGYNSQGHAASELPHVARWIAGAAQTQHDTQATNTKNPTIDQTGDSIWVILQGSSAPVNAFFALVLLCVGYGQLKAIHRQADIAEKTLIPAERAYMFIQQIIHLSHQDLSNNRIWWSLRVVWQNAGKTPTRNLKLYTQQFLDDYPMPPDFSFFAGVESRFALAGPGGIISGNIVSVTGEDLLAVQNGEKTSLSVGMGKLR